jgi:hypothetical protein
MLQTIENPGFVNISGNPERVAIEHYDAMTSKGQISPEG